MTHEFQHELVGRPDFTHVKVNLAADQTIKAEASAMMTMDPHIEMKTRFRGGFKRFLGGESLFINEFTAPGMPGEITLTSGMPGDMASYHLDNEVVFLQSGAFLASGMGVEVHTKYQGLIKGFFSGAGLFLLKCEGQGDLFFNAYGGLLEIDVKGEYQVDTNHIVAFTEGLEYNITKFAGYKSLFFSGEGLVANFRGEGKVWVQTRSLPSFAAWVYPFRPVQNNN